MIDKAKQEQSLLEALDDLNAALLMLQKTMGIPALEITEGEAKAHSPMETWLRRATAQVQSAKGAVDNIIQAVVGQIEALTGDKELH